MLSPYDKECLELARTLISSDLRQHVSISDLARQVALSPTRLKEGFRELYGTTPFAYLRRQRMDLAAELLSDDTRTLKHIARTTGFHHVNNFIAAFSKWYGMSPKAYRRKEASN